MIAGGGLGVWEKGEKQGREGIEHRENKDRPGDTLGGPVHQNKAAGRSRKTEAPAALNSRTQMKRKGMMEGLFP